ncbi:MAG: hypothetical protein ABSF43_03910 [Rectinemataceae bacterium]|jgi:predicted ATPase
MRQFSITENTRARNGVMKMLDGLRIKNFKAWSDTGKLRLAPITVFFGTNSSGMSSIGQFLLLLSQTAESPDRHRVLHPGGGRTTPINLGPISGRPTHG